MSDSKEERKKYINIIDNIKRKLNASPLNYFIKSHYYSLKESELPSAKINVINRIKENKITLIQLKDSIDFDSEYNESIKEEIYDLQYQNNIAKEIIKFINLRNNELYYEKKLNNLTSIFNENTKLSETI